MKVEARDYICPICNTESTHSTNHEGEIYSGCRNCGGSVLYFKNDSRTFKPMFILNTYKFNLSKPEEWNKYYELVAMLENEHKYKKFDCLVHPRHSTMQAPFLTDGLEISVHDSEAFDNQFVTNKGRLFFWQEAIFPNADIREGYYLTTDKKNM